MEAESKEATNLPAGYRLVAIASDAWVLIAPQGIRVARYLGRLDRPRAVREAWEHRRRNE